MPQNRFPKHEREEGNQRNRSHVGQLLTVETRTHTTAVSTLASASTAITTRPVYDGYTLVSVPVTCGLTIETQTNEWPHGRCLIDPRQLWVDPRTLDQPPLIRVEPHGGCQVNGPAASSLLLHHWQDLTSVTRFLAQLPRIENEVGAARQFLPVGLVIAAVRHMNRARE